MSAVSRAGRFFMLVRDLSPLARKGALIAAAGLAVLLGVVALPYVWRAQIADEVMAQKAELALVSARVGRAHDRPRLTEADEPGRMLLPGSTAGTTLAAFQSLVNEAAGRSGMSVLRMQPLPTDEVKGLSPFRLAVDMSGSLEQLRGFPGRHRIHAARRHRHGLRDRAPLRRNAGHRALCFGGSRGLAQDRGLRLAGCAMNRRLILLSSVAAAARHLCRCRVAARRAWRRSMRTQHPLPCLQGT